MSLHPTGSAPVIQWTVYIHRAREAGIILLALSGTKHNKPQFDNSKKHEQSTEPVEKSEKRSH